MPARLQTYAPALLVALALGAGVGRAAPVHAALGYAGSGPVPDYESMSSVLVHRALDVVAPELLDALTEVAGGALHISESYLDDDEMVWTRDHHPIYVRRPDGRLKSVGYLAENDHRTRLASTSLVHDDPHATDEVLPLIHQNGNLVTNGRLVFVSAALIRENEKDYQRPALTSAGYRPRSRDEVVGLLAHAVGRPASNIVVFPELPGEATGHVDVWLLPLDPKTVMVPEIRGETLDALDDEALWMSAVEVALFLEARAADLAALGLTVERLPMVAPFLAPAVDGSSDMDRLHYSPANVLLLAHGGRRDVLIPGADLSDLAPTQSELQQGYEAEWAEWFVKHGWQPVLVDTTRLGRHLGLIRCVTAAVPESER